MRGKGESDRSLLKLRKRIDESGANQTEDTRWLEFSQPVVFGLPEARKGRGID